MPVDMDPSHRITAQHYYAVQQPMEIRNRVITGLKFLDHLLCRLWIGRLVETMFEEWVIVQVRYQRQSGSLPRHRHFCGPAGDHLVFIVFDCLGERYVAGNN